MTIKTGIDKIMKEISLLKLLKHDNVLTLHEIINDEEHDKLYLSKIFWFSIGSLRERRSYDVACRFKDIYSI